VRAVFCRARNRTTHTHTLRTFYPNAKRGGLRTAAALTASSLDLIPLLERCGGFGGNWLRYMGPQAAGAIEERMIRANNAQGYAQFTYARPPLASMLSARFEVLCEAH
jgi:hypothetical protein